MRKALGQINFQIIKILNQKKVLRGALKNEAL